MTLAEYARHRGVSREAVRKAVDRGRITLIGPDEVDPGRADREWALRTSPSRVLSGSKGYLGGRPKGSRNGAARGGKGPINFAQERAKREKYTAEKARLEVVQMAGKMVSAAKVERAAFDAWHKAREVLEAVPARCAERLALLVDPVEIRILLEQEIADAMTTVSTWAEAQVPRSSGASAQVSGQPPR